MKTDRAKLVEKDLGLGGAVAEESSTFLQGGYPCVVLASCFHVLPEWPSVVSHHSLFSHSVHILVLCFPHFSSVFCLEKPIVIPAAGFPSLLVEPFLPSQEFFDVVANPREVGTIVFGGALMGCASRQPTLLSS